MPIEEKIREIMLSEKLPDSEKLDRLHALIPPDAFKIDNLNQATPAQLKQLKEALAVDEALQQFNAELLRKAIQVLKNLATTAPMDNKPPLTSKEFTDLLRSQISMR
jgi:hypothetical protein